MTNAQIILNARIELMEQGVIGSTGRYISLEKDDGSREIIPEPEEIFTYSAFLEQGYQVKKGQKAIASIEIWKHTDADIRKDKNSGDEVEVAEKMFKKTAYFFRRNQVEPIGKTA